MMNQILTDIAHSSSPTEIQGVTMLMVFAVVIIFLVSWIINRISILHIRKDSEKIRDLSITLQHTLNVSGSIVIRLNLQDRMGYNMHGNFLPAEGMSYQESLDYIHPDDRGGFVEFMRKMLNGTKIAECTFRWDTSLKQHLGHWRYIHDTGIVEYVSETVKRPFVLYCTLRDITEQTEQEQEDSQMTGQYRTIFEQSITGLAFYDKDGNLITANKKMQEILKFQSEDDPYYYSNTIYDMPTFREILNNRRIEELFFCTKSVIIERGVNCYTEMHVHPIYDDEGQLLYISFSIRDITQERELYLRNKENEEAIRRTNEAIQQYERELQYLMDNCDMRFFRASRTNCTVTFFKSMNAPERVLSFEELVNNHFMDSPFKNGLMDYENYFNVQRTDLTLMRPIFHQSKELQWNFIDSVPSFDENGVMTGTYGIIRNVNALIDKQEQLKRETERANQSGMLKSTFMANMTHEIRTPLNAIVGFSDVLPMLQTPEEKQEIIRVIMNNCDMLLRLINDILVLSNVDANAMEIVPQKIDAAVAFDSVCQSLAQRVQEPGVEFVKDNPYEVCKTSLDGARINQVITNFVTNAVKYTHQGHIRVGYRVEERQGQQGFYAYCEDTGSGIPKDQCERVFERFVKLNDFIQGTGLGLSICKAIIEKCGGVIGVDSEVDKGSTFWFWVPATVQELKEKQS